MTRSPPPFCQIDFPIVWPLPGSGRGFFFVKAGHGPGSGSPSFSGNSPGAVDPRWKIASVALALAAVVCLQTVPASLVAGMGAFILVLAGRCLSPGISPPDPSPAFPGHPGDFIALPGSRRRSLLHWVS